MNAEAYRPRVLDEVIGHEESKQALQRQLTTPKFAGSVLLVGSPGIGKTTLALCAAQTFGFEILEINASKSIRSFEDVQALRDACRSPINIQCMLRGDNKRTCVILDEVDGSDPHAQAKIMEWIADPTRAIPIVCTGNEVPTIFRRHQSMIQIYRCFPPRAEQVQSLFPHQDVSNLMKECQHDVRRVFHRLQQGVSDVLPKVTLPPTGLPIETAQVWRQMMFGLDDPLECPDDTPGIVRSFETKSECKNGGIRVRSPVSEPHLRLQNPDKSHNSDLPLHADAKPTRAKVAKGKVRQSQG